MKIETEYKDANGELHTMRAEGVGNGEPLAEKVRRSLNVIPDGGYAVAVRVDGEQLL